MYKIIIRPLLFLLSAEQAHKVSFNLLKIGFKIPGIAQLISLIFAQKTNVINVAGLTFPNRVGLAAGFDKDAKLIDEFAAFGFGFIEVGTVTPLPQGGNEKPRLFRLKEDQAIINRMGFNNEGVKPMVERLKNRKSKVIIGGNIGKNKITPIENATDDYVICFKNLFDYVDYFVVNVSSPNTQNLRSLQEKEPLTHLLTTVQAENKKMKSSKPIFLKIAPDLSTEQLDDIVEIVLKTQLAGIVATNTTLDRSNLISDPTLVTQQGGLSGKPLSRKSTDVIKYINTKSGGKIPIIAAGGIFTVADAQQKIDAGASLVQLYTGFIYEGPNLVKQLNKSL